MSPKLRQLLRQALGAEPAREEEWPALQPPDSELLPSVAAQLSSEELSDRAKGLKRYTWMRYQLAQKEALRVWALAPEHLLLADDLYLAGEFYLHPSARVLHGIDFLTPKSQLQDLAKSLPELGWSRPAWPDGPDYQEWRGPDQLRLRLHTSWLRHHRGSLEQVFERAIPFQDYRALSPVDQLCRCCWQGLSHLWLLDAHTLLRREPSLPTLLPTEFQHLARRWEQLSREELALPLPLAKPKGRQFSAASFLLGLSHRRRDIYSTVLEELSMQLVSQRCAGWPREWLQALCQRWSLPSAQEIPRAFYQRLRGDFS